MAAQTTEVVIPLAHFLQQSGELSLLRFSTAGSVDDGKSTLIGRLLYDTQGAYDDQIEAVRKSALNRSTGPFDFSLLTDGLKAEREQGITIDVAYRYFATSRRKFIIADTPGHEQYTRNMATGASTCDVALILVDARKGVVGQSRRHAFIAALLGIRELLVVVNKMDLVDFDERVYLGIREEFQALRHRLRGANLSFVPVSALEGDNVVTSSPRTPWYSGPSVLEFLETVNVGGAPGEAPFRFPVQYVLRPGPDFRGFAGQIVSGEVRQGNEVLVLPSARHTRIARVVTFDGDLERAVAPMSVTLVLEDEIDLARGGLIADGARPPQISRWLAATLVWMSPVPLEPGTTYLLRHGPAEVQARVDRVVHRLDIETLDERPAEALALNEIGLAVVETTQPLAFDPYRENRGAGAFVLIDPITNLTVAAGMIERAESDPAEARRRARRPAFRFGPLTPAERRRRSGHRGCLIICDTASEFAVALERRLFEHGAEVVRLAAPVAPVEALVEAGLLVMTLPPGEGACCRVDLDLVAAGDGVDQAVAAAIARLEEAGVLDRRDEFAAGEGI